MKRLLIFGVSLLAISSLAFSNEISQLDFNADAQIMSGSGCRSGTFDYEVSSDNQYIAFVFKDYDVIAGIGAPTGTNRDYKDCFLRMKLNIPQGWQVGIDSVEMRGYVDLQTFNSRALIQAAYSVEGSNQNTMLMNRRESGPYTRNYWVEDTIGHSQMQWTRCNYFPEQTITLKSYIEASAYSDGRARMLGDRQYWGQYQKYHFAWRRCNQQPNPTERWYGSCQYSLETVWGSNIREVYGRSIEYTEQAALRTAKDDAFNKCEDLRGGAALEKCTFIPSSCTATLEQ